MKKLSLVLALVLVLTCGVLAACTDDADTSSAAESVAESKAESKVESTIESTVESTAESTEEASSEAVSEEASSEAEVSAPEASDANLASGKTYTTSEQFRMGGADVDWGWDPNAAICYPDEPGSLTDGVIAGTDSEYTDAAWAGWSGMHPDYPTLGYAWITIDLGESKDLAKFVAHIGSSKLGAGIGATNMKIEVLVSDDGETWTSIGEAVPADDANLSCVSTTIEGAASGQYVQFRLARDGWMFVSELEVYGVAE